MLQFAYYSVISPEGCAGILWKSHDFAPDAARALKLTSKYLQELGCVDDVIEEPLGAAHRDHHQMAARLKMYLVKTLRELVDQPTDKLLAARYDKFRRMGQLLRRRRRRQPPTPDGQSVRRLTRTTVRSKNRPPRMPPDERRRSASTQMTSTMDEASRAAIAKFSGTCAQRPIIAVMFVSASVFPGNNALCRPAVQHAHR